MASKKPPPEKVETVKATTEATSGFKVKAFRCRVSSWGKYPTLRANLYAMDTVLLLLGDIT